MNYYIKNWEKMTSLGRYLTAKDTIKIEMGFLPRFTKNYKGKENSAALIVGFVRESEMREMKSKFPYITILEN